MALEVARLHIYPVKGLSAVDLVEAVIEPRGLRHDRRWMVVDENDVFRSQRSLPKMAVIRTEASEAGLKLTAPDLASLSVLTPSGGSRRLVKVWSSEVDAVDLGEEVAEWFSTALGNSCRLVYMDEAAVRPCHPDIAGPDVEVSFADGFPILLANTASLDDLNARMEVPVPMTRFRPNIVVSGATPFAEDDWRIIRIGSEAVLENVKGCGRCSVTTIDQDTGESRGPEPLTTLASFRKVGSAVNFGVNLVARKLGTVRVGDTVEIE